MRRRVTTAFALALALSTPGALAAQTLSDQTGFTSTDDGTLVHEGSGLLFPAEAAGFQRSDAAVFASNGDYVGLEYTNPISADGLLTIRVAVLRIPGLSPREHYVITKPMVMQSLEGGRTVAEGVFRRVEGSEAYRGLFTGQIKGVPWMRGLWTFEHGAWDLRVSADFQRLDQIRADEAVAEFVTALNAANAQEWDRETSAAESD